MTTLPPPGPPTPDDAAPSLDRRDFLKVAGVGAGLLLAGACDTADGPAVPGLRPKRRLPLIGGSSGNIVVIGAGAFGGWTAYYLRRMGAKVTLVDAYGPGNSRATSGDETRGIRSSYGDRDTGELWMRWAVEAMARWKAWDEEWSRDVKLNLFHTTGDLLLRDEWDPYMTKTKELWEKHSVPHEVLTPDEVRRRWPVIAIDDITAILSEPNAGVVRARRATQAIAAVFERLGGTIMTGRVRTPTAVNGRIEEVVLESGERLRADAFVFACGPWLGKTFPELLGNRMRTPMGHVCYFGTPPHDNRFSFPNLPSFNFSGVTGWPTLPVDSRGFRVRGSVRAPAVASTGANGPSGGGGRGSNASPASDATSRAGRTGAASDAPTARSATPSSQLDPDLSDRWSDAARIEGPRRFLAARFPILSDAPLLETRACHYEQTSSRNFIIDRHPQMSNVWISGGGNAEGFKFGPVVGEYTAQRVLGEEGDSDVAKGFRIPETEYETAPAIAGGPASGERR